MFTRCPHCRTVFRVTEEQLGAAGGNVRCGNCRAVFNGREHLTSAAEPATTTPDEEPAEAPPAQLQLGVEQASAPETAEPETTQAPSVEPETTRSPSTEPVPEVLADDLRAVARTPSMWSSVGWAAAIVMLAGLLVAQVGYFMRDELARFPVLRPALVRLCALAGCKLALPRETNKLRLLSRSVAADPRDERTLVIQATFANVADHPQPYPVLEVELSDIHGQLIAMRRFQPAEYLANHIDPTSPMPPDTPTHVRLRVVKPQAEVTNFQFEFR